MSADAPDQQKPDTNGSNGNSRKKHIGFAVFSVIIAIGLTAGYFYWGYTRTHVATDDAFIEGSVHAIAPRISGFINSIEVSDDQPVKAGDLLVTIDPDIYRQRVADAEASAGAEADRASELGAAVSARRAAIAASKAALEARMADRKAKAAQKAQAELDLKRATALFDKKVIAAERLEKARTQLDTAMAALEASDGLIEQARASVRSDEAMLKQTELSIASQRQMILKRQAQAGLERLQLSYTRITAPADGYVTRKNVELGNLVQPGQPMMSVVSMKDAYIVANYKETSLHLLKAGMKAEVRIDAYPGKVFKAHVESIMSGTGSAFTLFPPENASGNYVKVVQRIPVKIVFDNLQDAMPYLRIGMSVVPTVLTKE